MIRITIILLTFCYYECIFHVKPSKIKKPVQNNNKFDLNISFSLPNSNFLIKNIPLVGHSNTWKFNLDHWLKNTSYNFFIKNFQTININQNQDMNNGYLNLHYKLMDISISNYLNICTKWVLNSESIFKQEELEFENCEKLRRFRLFLTGGTILSKGYLKKKFKNHLISLHTKSLELTKSTFTTPFEKFCTKSTPCWMVELNNGKKFHFVHTKILSDRIQLIFYSGSQKVESLLEVKNIQRIGIN